MLDQFDELSKKLLGALPQSFQAFEQEVEQKFKEILRSAFERMDLVSRKEFDVQVKVLIRTREKLDALEAQVERLLRERKDSQEGGSS